MLRRWSRPRWSEPAPAMSRRSSNLTDPYRRELLAHCYRMLGSLTEAEDMLQETLLAAWRGLAGFEGRSSLRSWLYRIATNTCLNAVRAGARRIPSEPTPPFQPPEPTQRDEIRWLQPYPDTLLEGIADTAPGPEARYSQSEAIELAFVAGLQRMPPRQAATVLLRDVLGFGTEEVAAMLKTSQTAIKGTLQRGRAALESSRNTTDRRRAATTVGRGARARPALRRRVRRCRHRRRAHVAHRRRVAVHASRATPIPRLGCDPVLSGGQLCFPWRTAGLPAPGPSEQPTVLCQLPQ